jgi:nucleotide-binding universal stress UspA family protein
MATFPPKRIVVGVDGSEQSAVALRWAIREASLHQGEVTVLHALSYLQPFGTKGIGYFDPNYGEADAQAALDAFVEEVVNGLALDPPPQVTTQVTHGLPAEVALDASEQADLLVVGARGLGGFRGLLLGSVSQQCLHHAKVPICVVRPTDHAPGVDAPVVVGVDGSDTAKRALGIAVAEARARGVPLRVVHDWSAPLLWALPDAIELDRGPYQASAEALVADLLAEVDTSGIEVTTKVSSIGAIPATLEAAEDAGLVVVGTRGIGGFRGMLLGSVAHAVAQHAPCPVLVVPTIKGDERP